MGRVKYFVKDGTRDPELGDLPEISALGFARADLEKSWDVGTLQCKDHNLSLRHRLFPMDRDTMGMEVLCTRVRAGPVLLRGSCAHPVGGEQSRSSAVHMCHWAQQPGRRHELRPKGGRKAHAHPATSCPLWGKGVCAFSLVQP